MIKIIALSPDGYFGDTWNKFDFLVVVCSLVEIILALGINKEGDRYSSTGLDTSIDTNLEQHDLGHKHNQKLLLTILSSLRAARIIRILKIARTWTILNRLMILIGDSLGSVGYLILILVILLIVFGLLGVGMLRNYHKDPETNLPLRWRMNDFKHAFMVVFRIQCGEWIENMWNCMRSTKLINVCIPLFIATVMLGQLILLNLFLALLLNSFSRDAIRGNPNRKNKSQRARAGQQLGKTLRSLSFSHKSHKHDGRCNKDNCGNEENATPILDHLKIAGWKTALESKRVIRRFNERPKRRSNVSVTKATMTTVNFIKSGLMKHFWAQDQNKFWRTAFKLPGKMSFKKNKKKGERDDTAPDEPNGPRIRREASSRNISESTESMPSFAANDDADTGYGSPGQDMNDLEDRIFVNRIINRNDVQFADPVEDVRSRNESTNMSEHSEGDTSEIDINQGHFIADSKRKNDFLRKRGPKGSSLRRKSPFKKYSTSAILLRLHYRCKALIESSGFEYIILFFIALSSIALAFEDKNFQIAQQLSKTSSFDHKRGGELHDTAHFYILMRYFDIIFTSIFSLEMVIKWTGLGFRKYFSNKWCLLDFFIVMVAIISLICESFENSKKNSNLETIEEASDIKIAADLFHEKQDLMYQSFIRNFTAANGPDALNELPEWARSYSTNHEQHAHDQIAELYKISQHETPDYNIANRIKMLRVLRAFRALRPLRAMSRVSGINTLTPNWVFEYL